MIDLLLAALLTFAPQAWTTGYTVNECGSWCDGRTASMTWATPGRTAACPRSIPFGARIWIEGVGWRTCEDRGPDGFDVLVADSSAAYRITGSRKVLVLR